MYFVRENQKDVIPKYGAFLNFLKEKRSFETQTGKTYRGPQKMSYI
jgi:hypothetical protein